jgi:uncharacterized protein with GYD domain
MPSYISLLSWTEDGVKSYKDTLDRAQAASDVASSMGGSIRDLYWTMGPYDVVVVADFPDDESATAFLLKVGSRGAVRSTSMRAFSRNEMSSIIEKAG